MNSQHCGITTFKSGFIQLTCFIAVRCRPNDVEGALRLVVERGLHWNAVNPK